MTLYAAAVAATLLDVLAFVALVLPGRVVERNPLVLLMGPELSIAFRLVLVVCGLGLLTVTYRHNPEAWRLVRRVLGVAVVVGIVGAVSTVAAAG